MGKSNRKLENSREPEGLDRRLKGLKMMKTGGKSHEERSASGHQEGFMGWGSGPGDLGEPGLVVRPAGGLCPGATATGKGRGEASEAGSPCGLDSRTLEVEWAAVCLGSRPLGTPPQRQNLGAWTLEKDPTRLGLGPRPLEMRLRTGP